MPVEFRRTEDGSSTSTDSGAAADTSRLRRLPTGTQEVPNGSAHRTQLGLERVTGAEFRQARTSMYLTQMQLARRLAVSTATIDRWEHDRYPIPPMAALAMQALLREFEYKP